MRHPSAYFRGMIVLLFCSFFFLVAYSQEEVDFKDTFVEAESYFLFEEYSDALPLYQKLLQQDPENFNINYKIGRCYLDDPYQVARSIPYLEKAVQGTSPDYRIENYRERRAPLEAYYYLGNAYRMNNRLDEAIETYNLFKEILDDPLDYNLDLVDAQIEACQVAKAQFADPVYFTSYNLGSTINERFAEINPVISGDGSTLMFTRKLQFYDAVFYSTKQSDGTWSYPVNLTPSFGVDGNTHVTGISYQGDEVFVYRSDNYDGNIYVSHRQNGQWSKLEKLNDNINTKYWESHASISEDGKTLYFTSNRKGGYGNLSLDIYKSERKEGGDWGPAINLGPVINTRYDEETPFVTDNGKTLYFSSRGHYNMGGYDIFYSTKLENGQWSIPVNVGYPLNTTNDDLFFTPTADGMHAYYSKYDSDDSYGLADIYSMEIYTVHPRKFIMNGIVRTEGNVPADLTQFRVSLWDTKTGKVLDQGMVSSDGTYSLDALAGDLEVRIQDNDLVLSSEKITIPKNNPSDVISHTSTIVPGLQAEIPAEEEAAPEDTAENLPQISARQTRYDVTSDQSIPIYLELDNPEELFLETIVNGQPFKTEEFEVAGQRGFVHTYTPRQGINVLRFTVTNDEGLKNSIEITVNYTPVAEEMAERPEEEIAVQEQTASVPSAGWLAGIISLAEGGLKDFLDAPEMQGMQFGSPGELYNYLTGRAPEGHFTMEEVDALMMRYLTQKNLNFFADELYMQASDSISANARRLIADTPGIATPEVLLDTLFTLAESGIISRDELQDALYRIAKRDRNPQDMTDLLQSYAEGPLADFLVSMKLNPSEITESNLQDDGYLIRNAHSGGYSLQELESAIRTASIKMDLNFVYLSLLRIASDSLKETLYELDLWKENIRNTDELMYYLLDHAESDGYGKDEVMDRIYEISKDPYAFVEEIRQILEENATGSLMAFLQQMDVRNLHIDTYDKLINYLLSQSQYHDFTLPMIYQLLIDIIDVADVHEFIDLLLKAADERIASALVATDTDLYSTPLEVVQYLLAASGQYEYSQTDLINLLMKIMMERKPRISEVPAGKGWLSGLERSELVSALIFVNGIIVVLIIILIFRRRQKKEADRPPDR